ncbi:sigma-70 family RNA polymerase sigma factor [Singulisphaera sp. PoT]|uniref:sigma-70 family RNA polymerase sigma factor n=1 Tax=Singulisphaera sp. PoT TaxID=3411797 RepID=UPI003BF4E46C
MRHVRALFGAGAAGGASDAQLLDRFRSRDGGDPEAESAFAVLLARHGPMVLGVCRRALQNPDDAADAFQATFLILARKADTVRVDDSLGRWLYRVSRRVAHRARGAAMRRAYFESGNPGLEPFEPAEDADRRELLEALDEEVSRLPEPFRSTLVMCDLGGLAHEDAARQLGCAVGTVESRLSRARGRLRDRLTRRGLAPTIAGAFNASTPMVPESLSSATLSAAMRSATVSTSTLFLMEGALTEMLWTKLKTWILSLGALALAYTLGVAVAHRLKAEDEPRPAVPSRTVDSGKSAASKPIFLLPPDRLKPGHKLRITVLGTADATEPRRYLSKEAIVRPDGTISLGFYGELKVVDLNRYEVKEKLVSHMRKFCSDEDLGLVVASPGDKAKMIQVKPVDSSRVLVDDSLNYGMTAPTVLEPQDDPIHVKPGDYVDIDVLGPSNDRYHGGHHLVRADGTISLLFCGDLKVAGLNRHEIKIKLIERMRKFMSKEAIGTRKKKIADGKEVIAEVPASESDRVYVDDSTLFTEGSHEDIAPVDGPVLIKPGDILRIEIFGIFEFLDNGNRKGNVVRPDGTICLDFYGDLKVAGLDRYEAKAGLIEHLRKYFSEETLGLKVVNVDDAGHTRTVNVKPIDSDRVFVDESMGFYEDTSPKLVRWAK